MDDALARAVARLRHELEHAAYPDHVTVAKSDLVALLTHYEETQRARPFVRSIPVPESTLPPATRVSPRPGVSTLDLPRARSPAVAAAVPVAPGRVASAHVRERRPDRAGRHPHLAHLDPEVSGRLRAFHGGSTRFHIFDPSTGVSACGRAVPPNFPDLLRASSIPVRERCRAKGCRESWPPFIWMAHSA